MNAYSNDSTDAETSDTPDRAAHDHADTAEETAPGDTETVGAAHTDESGPDLAAIAAEFDRIEASLANDTDNRPTAPPDDHAT